LSGAGPAAGPAGATLPAPRLSALAGPMFAEMLLGISVGLVGTALAARQGDAAGGAFGLANQLAAMLFVLFRVIGAGISVVVSQALGGGHREAADRTARASIGASSWLGGGCALLAAAAAWPLLRLMNAPVDVLPLAAPFLQLLAPTVLLDAWLTTLASVLRSHLRSRDTLQVILLMQALHLALAWPAMTVLGWGLPGYAGALLVARTVGIALMLQLWRRQLGIRLLPAHWWRLDRPTLAPVLHIGLPGAAENIAWRLAFMASIAVVGTLGTAALATHAYVMQVIHLMLPFSMAIGLSAEIVVSHLVGAGQLHAANRLVRRSMARGLAIMAVVTLCVALAGPWLMRQFTQDAAIITLGSRILWLTIALETGRCFNLVLVNTLRAAGDARYPVLAGAVSFAGVLGLGSWWLGVGLGWGLLGVFIAYAADEWLRGLLMWRRWVSLRWVPFARRAHRRLQRGSGGY
jgi:putative MATE family efflux protein